MTPWNGNIFRVTGPICGEFTGALMFSLICTWTNGCASNRGTGDLRRHRTRYDVTYDVGSDPWFWCTHYLHVLQLDKTVIHDLSCFRILYISWHVESYEVSWQSAMTQSISPWIKHLAKLDSMMVLQILLVGSRSETFNKYWSHPTKWKIESDDYLKCANAFCCYSRCKQSLGCDHHQLSWKRSTVDDRPDIPNNGTHSHIGVGYPLFNSRVWTKRYSLRYVHGCVVLCLVGLISCKKSQSISMVYLPTFFRVASLSLKPSGDWCNASKVTLPWRIWLKLSPSAKPLR